jgi:REP element-mobilizing transposase RayT
MSEIKQQYLEGLKYNYKGENIIIQKVKKVNGNIVVITNKRTFNFTESEADEFEKSLDKYKEEKPISINTADFNLNDVLIEAINRVRVDKNYIQQANAICNITSQMINIKKLELLIKNK